MEKKIDHKVCTQCNKDKPLNEYTQRSSGRYYSHCRPCQNIMSRQYKANNKGKIAAYNKEYKADNADDISEYNHQYNLDNREAIQTRQTAQHRERKTTDPNFKLSCDLRNGLYRLIKNGPGEPGTGTYRVFKLLGCDYDFFINWLEFQLEDGMTMENHGEVWSTDHVMPCCKFDVTKPNQAKACFHWSNTAVEYRLANQSKNGKVFPGLIEGQYDIAKLFVEIMEDNEFDYEYTAPIKQIIN